MHPPFTVQCVVEPKLRIIEVIAKQMATDVVTGRAYVFNAEFVHGIRCIRPSLCGMVE